MIGLALEGGGARGSYQIGAYYALKHSRIKINGVSGTSIGSFNAAMISSGQEEELLKLWQNIDISSLLDLEGFKDIKISTLNKTFANIRKILKNKGMDTSKLKKMVTDYLDLEKFYNSKIDYGLVTVKLNNLKPIYKYKEDIPKDKIDDYILASCYLPVFKFEKLIDGNYYLDGGFYDNSPANMWFEKDYDKVYVVSLNSLGVKHRPIKKGKVIYIKPSRKLGSILNLNQQQISDNIRLGYFDTLKVIKNLDGKKFCFKRRKDWYYKFLNRKVDKRTLNRIKKFFKTEDDKTMILKSLEFIMNLEDWSYFRIYSPLEVINIIKKDKKEKSIIYKYVKKLKFI